MKKTILTSIVLILTISMSFGQSKTEYSKATFGVKGNCGMCKTTIEKAAKSVEGVSTAVWDKENKKIEVAFDASKTNLKAIHNAISESGYDTDKAKANENAYNNLAGCCQYDKEMNIGAVTKEVKKSCCGGAKKSCATKDKQ